MASHFMLGFHFLFYYCYYSLLLLLAAAEGEKCEQFLPCGYLGEISFPFTTKNNSDRGITIIGCEKNNTVKEVLLGNHTHQIDAINYVKNSIFILAHKKSPEILHSQQSDEEIHVNMNTIDFYGCSSYGSSSKENMFKYKECPQYDIYFNSSKPVKRLAISLLCLPVQVLNDYLNDCANLGRILEIELNLLHCEECFLPGSDCRLNHTNFECILPNNTTPPQPPYAEQHLRGAVIGLSIGLATMIIIALFLVLFLCTKRSKSSSLQNQTRTTNHRGFSRNMTNAESRAVYCGIPVFSYEELREATNNFDQAKQLGEGGFGTVYYGKLRDGREVAVKRLFERNYKPIESFSNEIQILTRIRHINLVSLYGCTSRHSRELLLVYEYIPNGTVSCHLHGEMAKHKTLLWHVRMKIAIETANALTYLHATGVIHRDVKTSNILLDNNFCVKVADFGLSRLFPGDVTHVSTAPRGTLGYVDPDYHLCYQLTSKSDVYSFGVVLVELITSLPAVDLTRDRDEIKLANLAIRKIQRREFCELVDPSLGFQSDESLKREMISVAELAFQCLQGNKELRPSMGEVFEVLQGIASRKNEQGNVEDIDVHVVREVRAQTCAIALVPNTWVKPQYNQHTLP